MNTTNNYIDSCNPTEKPFNINNPNEIADEFQKNFDLSKKDIIKSNPSFNKFNLNSMFIYESIFYENYISDIQNKNLIKLNSNQYDSLSSEYEQINYKIENQKNPSLISISKSFFDYFFKSNPIKKKNSIFGNNLKLILQKIDKNSSISIRKLSELYYKTFGIKISKTKIHNLLRYELNLRYLKTCPKNNKLTTNNFLFQKFFVVKIISRILALKGSIIFIDESGFFNQNNNFRVWRSKEENIYQNIYENKKFNLLMGVSKRKIIWFEINEDSTTSRTFLIFMKNMVQNMAESEIQQSLFFMDNLSSHKTLELYNFYKERKLKILFNVPYLSQFNIIEFGFRHINNIIYKKIIFLY